LGAVQQAFGAEEKGYEKIFEAMAGTDEFGKEFGDTFNQLPEGKRKMLAVRTLLPIAREKILSNPQGTSAKRKGILEGYRGKAAGKGIPWKENREKLYARGLDVWEKERAACADGSVQEPSYWQFGGKGTLHSYDEGNCNWDAAFDAAMGAYELVHAHHFPDVPPKECFFQLHRVLDDETIDALEGSKGAVALDVGCGTGTSTFSLRETLNARGLESCKLIGVDLCTHFVAVAKHRIEAGDKQGLPGELQFRHGNALSIGSGVAEAGEVDIFMASALTHELPQWGSTQLIEEAARLLRPGGVFGYFDLNPEQLLRDNPVSNIVDRVAISNEPFLADFLEFNLEETLEANGFDIVKIRSTNVQKWPDWRDCPTRIVIAKKRAVQ